MRSRFEGTSEALRSPFPWVALAAALALTAAGWFALERSRYNDAQVQFERRTETAAAAMRARMIAYEQVLRSGAAYMASSTSVTRADWRRFIANLQLEERFPGIQSVGYAEYVRSGTRLQHVERMRAEGFDTYEIRPPGGREEMAVIVYNEPYVGRNSRVLGLDMYADAVRRVAMDKARDTAEAAITGRVVLAGEPARGAQPEQAGFLMYVPVYEEFIRDLPRRDRRQAVSGYVFSPFRMQDLLRGMLDEGVLQVLDMRVYDETSRSTQAELIDTRTAWRATLSAKPAEFERIVNFPMPGRNWTIQFLSRPEFDTALQGDKPWILAAGGMLAGVVMFLLTTALVEAWNRANHLSMRDPLTGLYNRRYLEETMSREVPRALRLKQTVGVIVLDLDHFKQLNDTHGHEAGDFVLARVGELLRTTTRGGDIACRFGGEEFGVILPGASLEVARIRAEALRTAFQGMSFDLEGLALGTFTLSAGVAALGPLKSDWAAVLREADRALYAAKQAGRNRVVVAS
ncbi:MAG TPA: CHASE domain-containing protein [Usitatibacter sp.]|nr:CHASE domain-containing protein [Usitatibacter sp.]